MTDELNPYEIDEQLLKKNLYEPEGIEAYFTDEEKNVIQKWQNEMPKDVEKNDKMR